VAGFGTAGDQLVRDLVFAACTVREMPTISAFYGIIIRMFWADHGPPHFHASYGENEAIIDIQTLEVTRGGLPARARSLTMQWARMHHQALLENWKLCANKQTPNRIPPLP
jgi:hypothetical protein